MTPKQIIWTTYIIIWVYFLFLDTSYGSEDRFFIFIVLGWIPFLVLHFLWKNGKSNVDGSAPNEDLSLLFEVVDKEQVQKLAELANNSDSALRAAESELDNLYKETGKNAEYYENSDVEKVDPQTLKKYFQLKDDHNKALVYSKFLTRYFEELAALNIKLKSGLDKAKSEEEFIGTISKLREELAEHEANLSFSSVLSDTIVEAREKGKSRISKKKLINELNKKVEELRSNPE